MASFEEKQEKGRKMESKVNAMIHHGKPKAAKKVFADGWEDSLPKMPIRFTVLLEEVEIDEVKLLMKGKSLEEVMATLSSIEFKLANKIDPRNPERVAVYYQEKQGSKRIFIGFMPSEEIDFLKGFGPNRKRYDIRFQSAKQLDTNKPQVVIEFIRPELHICSSCGKEHFDATINCADCRSKRKRLEATLQETKEKPVVIPVKGAFQKIQEDTFNKKGELDKIIKETNKQKDK